MSDGNDAFQPDESGIPFVLDDEEWDTTAEIQRCDWNYPPRSWPTYSPGFTCYKPVYWRINTTFSNASKTETFYCREHGLMFHEGTAKWANIDHATKASTDIWNLSTGKLCVCSKGDDCEAMLEYAAKRVRPTSRIVPDDTARKAWDY